MAVILLIKTADQETIEVPLFGMVTVGRSSSCDFKVEDSKISGKHCSIELTKKGEVLVKDLGSTNGTYVNNSKITHSLFRLNDTVLLGTTVIVIDERRLSTLEKKAIGITIKRTKLDSNELPELTDKSQTQMKEFISGSSVESKKENKISLNKDHKLNKDKSRAKETNIEPEPSSGSTKLLKLDKSKKEKK